MDIDRYCLRAAWACCAAFIPSLPELPPERPEGDAAVRLLKSALLSSALMLSTTASAQSDGTLEETYARECPQHQDTAACNALRDALLAPTAVSAASMESSAAGGQDNRVWGDFASLAGTVWRTPTGAFYRYRWEQPGEVMLIETVSATSAVVHRASRSPEGSVQLRLHSGEVAELTFPRPGIVVQSFVDRRLIMRFAPDSISLEQQALRNGAWESVEVGERRPASDADYESALAVYTEKLRLDEEKRQQYAKTWGKLPQLVGYWTSGGYVWRGQWDRGKTILTADVWTSAGEFAYKFRFYVDATRELQAASGASNYKVAMLPDGNVFLDGTDDAIIWRSATAFDFENGRMKAGTYVRNDSQTAGWNGTFRKMSAGQAQAFREQVKRYDRQQASGGDSGLLGALAMATGAALAGGNAEHVMGAAMKGAELSTDNQMTRNVLAGQGDQMIAAGTQRMYEESAQRSASSSSSAQGAGPASRTASVSPPPGALGQSAGAGNGPPIRFYYVVSLVPTANDTRNPLCVSNVVTLDARLDADPWGRRAKAAPLVEAYRDKFVSECSRLGRITSLGNLYYTIEGVDSGWPYPSFHPSDRKVMLP